MYWAVLNVILGHMQSAGCGLDKLDVSNTHVHVLLVCVMASILTSKLNLGWGSTLLLQGNHSIWSLAVKRNSPHHCWSSFRKLALLRFQICLMMSLGSPTHTPSSTLPHLTLSASSSSTVPLTHFKQQPYHGAGAILQSTDKFISNVFPLPSSFSLKSSKKPQRNQSTSIA